MLILHLPRPVVRATFTTISSLHSLWRHPSAFGNNTETQRSPAFDIADHTISTMMIPFATCPFTDSKLAQNPLFKTLHVCDTRVCHMGMHT